MIHQSDWEKSEKRFRAFWEREMIDRCCFGVTAPVAHPEPMQWMQDNEEYRFDPRAVIRQNRAWMERNYYGGDAFPVLPLDLGASGHAGFFKGARFHIQGTVWFTPTLDTEHLEDLTYEEDSLLFRKTLELAKAAAEDSQGDYMIGMPDATGNADALSHLMGPEELLPAMLEEPEAVQKALSKIQEAYRRVMTEAYSVIRETDRGGSCVGWLDTWAPGFHAQMQSDMSVMISKEMFDTFILPELTAQTGMLDYALYHFDGIEQIRHLDTLLSLPRLRAIQWTQVEGQPPCTDFIPELKRIQAAGKCLMILAAPKQVPILLEELSSRGLYLLTRADSREEGEALLKTVSRLSHE